MNNSAITRRLAKMAGLVLVSSSALLLSSAALAINDPLHVHLHSGGSVAGKWHADVEGSVREFLGIPYAKAPVGDLRFAPPVAAKIHGTIEAKAFGASCMQNPGSLSAPGPLSEDCLSLNVYSPADGQKLPVMVWIHGGAFTSGGSAQYDAQRLAMDKNVVVVTLNYRLGALGFLSHPEMDAEQGGPSGNLGLLDQSLALKWVKKNIKRFGGDQNNITLFGESAGARSVCAHMVAPESKKLVDRFVMQSGVCTGGLPIFDKTQVEAISTDLGDAFCPDTTDQLACLREADPAALTAWGADRGLFGAGWGATIIPNGPMLPDDPEVLINSGKFNRGEAIIGTNLYEWGLFQRLGVAPHVANIADLHAYIDASFPPTSAPVLKAAYNPPVDALAPTYLTIMLSDRLFHCPARVMAKVLANNGSNVWLYSFEQGNPAHAFEIPYVFNYVSVPLGIDPTNSPSKDVFQDYWTAFADNGNPNNANQPVWPMYDASAQDYMVIKDAPAAGVGFKTAACDMWDALGY